MLLSNNSGMQRTSRHISVVNVRLEFRYLPILFTLLILPVLPILFVPIASPPLPMLRPGDIVTRSINANGSFARLVISLAFPPHVLLLFWLVFQFVCSVFWLADHVTFVSQGQLAGNHVVVDVVIGVGRYWYFVQLVVLGDVVLAF